MTLFLTEEDVRAALDPPAVIDAVREALGQQAAGRVDVQPRRRVKAPGAVLHTMSASLEYAGLLGWKNYVSTRAGAEFLLAVYRLGESKPAALIQADWLGRLRTGAVTAIAVDRLAGAGPLRLGVFGCGRQAATLIAAVAAIRPLAQVLVFCRDAERRRSFAEAVSREGGVPTVAADDPRQAAGADVVATITTSGEPVLERAWLAADALVCAAGANWPHRREIPTEVVAEAACIVCDDLAGCQLEAGDLLIAEHEGRFAWERAEALSSLAATPSLPPGDGLRLFKSVGSALFDVAAAVPLLRRAVERGLGREIGL